MRRPTKGGIGRPAARDREAPVAGRRRDARGAMTVEFMLILLASLTLFALVGEFFRISLIDQVLAGVTHRSTRAAAVLPTDTGCVARVQAVFSGDDTARWLFDRNDDGTLAVEARIGTNWPATNPAQEVQIAITWDDDPDGGVDWSDGTAGSCGDTGSWLRVRSQITVEPWFVPFRALAPQGFTLQHESWGRNNRL